MGVYVSICSPLVQLLQSDGFVGSTVLRRVWIHILCHRDMETTCYIPCFCTLWPTIEFFFSLDLLKSCFYWFNHNSNSTAALSPAEAVRYRVFLRKLTCPVSGTIGVFWGSREQSRKISRRTRSSQKNTIKNAKNEKVLKLWACLSTGLKQGSTDVLCVNRLVCQFKFVMVNLLLLQLCGKKRRKQLRYLKSENTKNIWLPDIVCASQSNKAKKNVAIKVFENSLNQVIVKWSVKRAALSGTRYFTASLCSKESQWSVIKDCHWRAVKSYPRESTDLER